MSTNIQFQKSKSHHSQCKTRLINYVHKDDHENFQRILLQVIQTKTTYTLTVRLLDTYRKPIFFTATLIPNIDQENKLISVTIEATSLSEKSELIQTGISDWPLFNHVDEAIFILSPEGTIINVNQAGEMLFGYKQEELIGKNPISFIPVNEIPFYSDKLKQVKQGISQDFETIFSHKTKKLVHIHMILIPVIVNNQLLKIYSISKNITQIITMKQQLQSLNIKYNNLLNSSPYGIFQVNTFGQFTEINPAGREMTGFTKEELLNKNFLDLLHPKDKTWVHRQFLEMIQQKSDMKTEKIVMLHKNDHPIIGNITSIPIIINHKVESIFGIFKNTTTEDILIENLTSEEEHFSQLFNEVPFPIFISKITPTNEKGKFQEVNKKACEILKYRKSELLKKSYKDIIPKEYIPLRKKSLMNLQEGKVTILKSIHVDKVGNKIPVELRTCISTYRNQKVFMTFATYNFENNVNVDYVSDDPGKNLRVLMAQMDINSSELAELTGLTVATISNLRTGKVKKPNIETARLISDVLGTKIHIIWPILNY
ncbi:PAS domain S-box protein [Anaerobacillus alkalilacustris]|nr:PAS domain S-box protein [Anaerobacillus alkalilacustris]